MTSSGTDDNIKKLNNELQWVTVVDDLNSKRVNKFLQNPFVPLGFLATTTALALGIVSMLKGDRQKQQKMMRYRVLAQGFTFGAMLVGMLVFSGKKSFKFKEE